MFVYEHIPKEKFNLWYSLFKQSNGRFVRNPYVFGDWVSVEYMFDDMDSYNEMARNYKRLTKDIVESRRGVIKRWLHKLTS